MATPSQPAEDGNSTSSSSGPGASYVHREGTRQYLETEVLPHVDAALAALLHTMQRDRLQLAAGCELDEGRFRRRDWRPFCAQEWLANYLLQHKPALTPVAQDVSDQPAAVQ